MVSSRGLLSGLDDGSHGKLTGASGLPVVLALRRLGFGISELGERKLKGLETVEVISLIWPKALKERIKTEGEDKDNVQAEIYESVGEWRQACWLVADVFES